MQNIIQALESPPNGAVDNVAMEAEEIHEDQGLEMIPVQPEPIVEINPVVADAPPYVNNGFHAFVEEGPGPVAAAVGEAGAVAVCLIFK